MPLPSLISLLTRARKLAHHEDTWECGVWLARHWIVEHRQPPYRPNICMVIGDCGVPHLDLSKPPYTTDDILDNLLRAMLKPAHGIITPRRPTRVRCADAHMASQIAPHLAEIGVACEVSAVSAAWRHHQHACELKLNRGQELLAGLASIPGASLALQCHFYDLAAAYCSLAPWRMLNDAYPLEIRCPATSAPRYGVVMGSGGEIFGLSVYDTVEQARAIYRDDLPDTDAGQGALILFFDAPTSMSFEDLDAMAEQGWALAAPIAYPILGRSVADNVIQPSLSDLVWMEGALAALLRYLREYLQLDGRRVLPAELTMPVQTISGTVSVALRLPAFDNPKLRVARCSMR